MKKGIRPNINYSFVPTTIHFKPWKGKISAYEFYHDADRDLDEVLDELIEDFKKQKMYRRRTIVAVSQTWHKHIKL